MVTEDVVFMAAFAIGHIVVIGGYLFYSAGEVAKKEAKKLDEKKRKKAPTYKSSVATSTLNASFEKRKERNAEAHNKRMNELRAKSKAETKRRAEELAKKQYATRKSEVMAKWSKRKAEQSNKRILNLQISQLDYSKMETYAGDRIRSWDAYTSAIHVKCEDSYEIIADLTQFQVTGVREYFPTRGMFSVNYPYELYSAYETSHEGEALSGHE